MLSQVFHPELLEWPVVLRRLDQLEEAFDGAVEPVPEDGIGDPAR